jgi:hypothetical protein
VDDRNPSQSPAGREDDGPAEDLSGEGSAKQEAPAGASADEPAKHKAPAAASVDEPAKPAHAQRFWLVVLLIGIPLLFALGAGIWADYLLTIDPVPNSSASGIGFDVSDSPELDVISAVGNWASPMAASHATEIDVIISGCQKAEVHAGFLLDERWYLASIHRVGRSVASGGERRMTSCAGL